MMELYQHQGEPTQEELDQRVALGNHQLGYRQSCPNCEKDNTSFIRNDYWMCHSCVIWFTTQDAIGYYDPNEIVEEQDEP